MTDPAFTELRIGPVDLPNRLALAPVKTALGGTDGGLFRLAPLTPGKETMARPLRYLVEAVERSSVDVRTGFEATADIIEEMEPDRVIVATGSEPVLPSIPGLDDPLTAERAPDRGGSRHEVHRRH